MIDIDRKCSAADIESIVVVGDKAAVGARLSVFGEFVVTGK